METAKHHVFNFVIADDDPDDQYSLQRVIWEDNRGHKITSVYNGLQLLEYLLRKGTYKNRKEPAPDCVFLDLNMPLLTGSDVLKKIKTVKELCNLPIFVLSSSSCPNEKEILLKLGAKACFVKKEDKALKIMFKEVMNELLVHQVSHKLS